MSIFVCGGSRGIGRAIAVGLAEPGAHVIVNYLSSEAGARETAALVEDRGARATLIAGDVADPGGAAEVIARARESTDRLDVLVHCAVKAATGPILDAAPATFLEAVQVNALSLLYLAQAALPLIGEGSSIIYLTSRGSRLALKDYAAVGAPKALAEAIVRYLAVELAGRGARANCVSPTALDTDAFRAVFPDDYEERLAAAARNSPSGRAVDLDDVVEVVRFLASPAASMIQGQVLTVDGASTLAS
jgi:enoyl-[acyl-carrier protein] reductase III